MSADLSRMRRLGRTNRRRFLRRSPLFLFACTLAACSQPNRRIDFSANTPNTKAQAQSLPPTPACGDSAITPTQTPGPFFTPESPLRQSLIETDTEGTRLIVTGQVLATNCQPLANALVDVWQTNAQGQYDNEGYQLRGHQFTDTEGRYRIETIVPGIYPGRTRHLHIKVQAQNRPALTTQLYFPEEPLNERDFLFQPALLMAVQETGEEQQAKFNFVLS